MQFDIIDTTVYLFGNLFRLYIINLLFQVFFYTPATKIMRNMRIIGYILYYAVNSAAFLYFAWPPSIILFTNVVGLSMISLTYNGEWKFRLCSIILSLAIYTVCEDFIYYIIVILGIEHILVIGIVAADLLFFMIVLILKKSIEFKNSIIIPSLEWIAIIIIPALSLVVSTVVLDKCSNEIAVAIGEMSLASVNILVFFLIDRIQTVYKEQLDVSLLRQQNKAYENQLQLISESEERMISLRHDLKNHFFSLERLADRSAAKDIKEYIEYLISKTDCDGTFAETGNFLIDSFINAKLAKANALGAEVVVDLTISENILIEERDISVILGNLLDNAITAIEKCSSPKWIKVVMRETPGKLYIKIENTHQEIIRTIGNTIITTKKDKYNHGIGLKNVKKIVDSHCGTMEISHDENTFSVKLLLFL